MLNSPNNTSNTYTQTRKFIEKLNKTSEKFSKRVLDILSWNYDSFDYNFKSNDNYVWLKDIMQKYLSSLINDWFNEYDFLDSYNESITTDLSKPNSEALLNKNKLKNKIDKNLIIHLRWIFGEFLFRSNQNIDDIDFKSDESIKIMKSVVKDFILIILTFWDSVSIDFVNKSLRQWSVEVRKSYNSFYNVSWELSKKEEELKSDNLPLVETDLEPEFLQYLHGKNSLSKMYRNIYRDTFEPSELDAIDDEDYKEKKTNREYRIKIAVTKNLKEFLYKIYELYEKVSYTRRDIKKNANLIALLYKQAQIFYKVLLDKNLLNIDQANPENYEENPNLFSIFNIIYGKSFIISNNDDFLEFLIYNNIAITDSFSNQKNTDNDSENESNLNDELLNEFIYLSHNDFISEVNSKGTITFITTLFKNRNKWDRITKFANIYGVNEEVVRKQFLDIETLFNNNQNLTIGNLIDIDQNHFIFLYNYYRFDSICKTRKKIDKEKYYNDLSKNDGFQVLLKSKLWIRWKFSDKWHYNTSSETFQKTATQLVENFSRWYINIEDTSIEVTNKDNKKEQLQLFLHTKLYSPWSHFEEKEVLDYLNVALDICIWLKQWKRDFSGLELEYLNTLQRYSILPDNLWKIDKQKGVYENLWQLISWLKVVKYKADILVDENKDVDSWFEELQNILWADLFIDNKNNWSVKSSLGSTKSFWRSLEKLISKYNWDIHKLWDLVRWRIVCPDLNTLIDKIKKIDDKLYWSDLIDSYFFDDQFWDIFSLSKKKSWFRDFKVDIRLKNGMTVELQLQLWCMAEAKTHWIEFENDDKEKLNSENALLSKDELLSAVKIYYRSEWKKLDLKALSFIYKWWLNELKLDSDFTEYINTESNRWKISWDDTYHVIRLLSDKSTKEEDKQLKKKLTRIERLIFEKSFKSEVLWYIWSLTKNKKQ